MCDTDSLVSCACSLIRLPSKVHFAGASVEATWFGAHKRSRCCKSSLAEKSFSNEEVKLRQHIGNPRPFVSGPFRPVPPLLSRVNARARVLSFRGVQMAGRVPATAAAAAAETGEHLLTLALTNGSGRGRPKSRCSPHGRGFLSPLAWPSSGMLESPFALASLS